jgi:hypothetical protein
MASVIWKAAELVPKSGASANSATFALARGLARLYKCSWSEALARRVYASEGSTVTPASFRLLREPALSLSKGHLALAASPPDPGRQSSLPSVSISRLSHA